MTIEQIKTSDLIPYARNAKKHDAGQVAAIAASIKEFGFNNPVLVDEANCIIAGHGRVLAAQKLGLAEVPCIRLAHLNENQRRAYILADNRLAETGGGWDLTQLQKEAEEIAFESMEHFSRECLDLDELLGDGITEEQQDELEEAESALTPYGHVHLLVTMTPNQAAKHLPGFVEMAKGIGAEVNHAGN